MTSPKFMNSSLIAERLGIRQSAVTNWITRGVLPVHLQPDDYVQGPDGCPSPPIWKLSKLGKFVDWYNERHPNS